MKVNISTKFSSPKKLFSSSVNKSQEIISMVEKSKHEFVKLAASDIDGIPRGKYVSKAKFLSAAKKGLGFCSVVFGWDSGDSLYDNTKEIGWHMGYADLPCSVDLNTYRKIPWENDLPFFLLDFTHPEKGKDLEVCPRVLLKKVNNNLQTELQLSAKIGPEFEWFNFKESPQSIKEKNYVNPEPLTPGMFGYSLQRAGQNLGYFQKILDYGQNFSVPIEGLHTETGPGVFEAAIEFCQSTEAADRAFLFKMMTKQIGHEFGIIPSFMAKPHSNLPGCGGHLHVSFHDKNDANVFYDSKDPDEMSVTCKHYIAGLIHCLPFVMPMYAPTINSYKRLVEGYWAPTTPTWGIENRTVAIRYIPGKKPRVEVRIPGCDANPYLAIAASIASGIYGIKHKLNLPPPVIGNGYVNVDRSKLLPRNLWEATQAMKGSSIAKELFGETFVDHFAATREWEWRQFQKSITNWEIERYFEII